MRLTFPCIAVLTIAARSAAAQGPAASGRPAWTPAERAARAAALNAILTFRSDLRGDSTRIAACRLASEVQDTATGTWVQAAFRPLLTAPLAPQSSSGLDCSVYAFQQPGTRVLWLAGLIEVRRRGALQEIRAGGGVSFEADFQLLVGKGYRQFEHYELRPFGAGREVAWRVVRYELRGVEFLHEHSRSSGPP